MRLISALFICILLMEPAFFAVANEPEEGARTITAAEGLAIARNLAVRGEFGKAKELYALLLKANSLEIRIEAAFQLAELFIAEKNYKEAINILRSILNRFPDLPRVRLELARAYFLDEKYADAEFNFNLVKGGKNIPPAVLDNIDIFLDAIRRKKNWSLDFGFNIVPDSNLNQASGASQECVNIAGSLLCRDIETEDSGIGIQASMTGNYYLKFNNRVGLRNTAGVYLTDYGGSNYDDYILYAASGPRFLFTGGEISLQPTFTKRLVRNKRYSERWGVRLDGQKSFNRLIVGTGLSAARNTYDTQFIDDLLRGNEYSAYITPRLILTNQCYVQSGVAYSRHEANNQSYAYNSWRYSLGAYYFFKYGFSLSLNYSITRDSYREERLFVSKDNRFDTAKLKNITHIVSTELSTNIFERYGITPAVQYNYTRRTSNIWSSEYDRHRVNMAFELSF